ncbi:MAG: TonB family protein, partial [Candidatus Omnitrophota bacterium]|nr:TonB family protein [Candidatus Omnitrophota bacterium]
NTAGALIVGTKNGDPSAVGKYKAIVDLLRTIGDTKILSSPRIMVLNNQEAKILVGSKDAYITSTTSQAAGSTTVTSQTVNFVDVGIKLFVTPTINRDGFVTMKIKPEVSSSKRTDITSDGKITQIPIVTTSESETTVMVKDGVTIIIGGLQKDKREKLVKKVPILGDIPIIGHAFRNTSDDLTKTELVILLTPHIMSGESTFSDFREVKPTEGVMAKMSGGNIVLEKVSGGEIQSQPQKEPFPIPFFKKGENLLPEIQRMPTQSSVLNLESSEIIPAEPPKAEMAKYDEKFDYYKTVAGKIDQIAKMNPPEGRKGQVDVNFKLSAEGNLSDEPQVVESTDSTLNDYALKAIRDASPFPSFPQDLEKKEEIFKVSLRYE